MIAQIAAALVVALLRYLQGREDLKAALRAELTKEAMNYAIQATEWKARTLGRSFTGSELRVRNVTLTLSIQSPAADAGGGPENRAL